MALPYTPKTDWIAGDGIIYSDLNEIGENLVDLDVRASNFISEQTMEAEVRNTDFDTNYSFTLRWTKYYNIVTLYFPYLLEPGEGSSTTVRIYPDDSNGWDDHLLGLQTGSLRQRVPFITAGVGPLSGGMISLPITTSEHMQVYPVISGVGYSIWAADANNRGWYEQSITYYSSVSTEDT